VSEAVLAVTYKDPVRGLDVKIRVGDEYTFAKNQKEHPWVHMVLCINCYMKPNYKYVVLCVYACVCVCVCVYVTNCCRYTITALERDFTQTHPYITYKDKITTFNSANVVEFVGKLEVETVNSARNTISKMDDKRKNLYYPWW
jgi:hypothetical protein